ncbi:MAG TPA: hypothetical protein GYA07_11120 [Verrucomicrobia bacterium]|nr:hypothetical protein [Verrucomicrobiota bacterium]HOB33524.1 hypothetical protein [Verrucomicrobiota bacterium]HOP98962.1 hypothetical protein [Verrucomicrobiota bacterium]HPU55252.1 hypothetical protein [Verrucomicrobiota bacterium]
MAKTFSPLLLLPLLLCGCVSTSITNLTPLQQVRNESNLYPVEVAFRSNEQSLRWDSIRPQIVVGNDVYPMRPTPLMTNRWEGLVPVPPGVNSVRYFYKFEFLNNAFGAPKPNSAVSREYLLRIVPE